MFDRCLMDAGPILQAFRFQTSIKMAINFGIVFWKAEKSILDQWESKSIAQAPSLRTPKAVLTGLQDWSPVPEGNRNGGMEKLCPGSDTPWAGGPANSQFSPQHNVEGLLSSRPRNDSSMLESHFSDLPMPPELGI